MNILEAEALKDNSGMAYSFDKGRVAGRQRSSCDEWNAEEEMIRPTSKTR